MYQKFIIIKRDEFKKNIIDAINRYLDDFEQFEPDPHLCVNPRSLFVDVMSANEMYKNIEDSDEAVENAAAAEGAETKESDDYQVSQNPDFYPLRNLLKVSESAPTAPDPVAVESLCNNYFK